MKLTAVHPLAQPPLQKAQQAEAVITYDPSRPYASILEPLSQVVAFHVLPSHAILLARRVHASSRYIVVEDHLPMSNVNTTHSIRLLFHFGDLSIYDRVLSYFSTTEIFNLELFQLLPLILTPFTTPVDSFSIRFSTHGKYLVIYDTNSLYLFNIANSASLRIPHKTFKWKHLGFARQDTLFAYKSGQSVVVRDLTAIKKVLELFPRNQKRGTRMDLSFKRTTDDLEREIVGFHFVQQEHFLSLHLIKGHNVSYCEIILHKFAGEATSLVQYCHSPKILWGYKDKKLCCLCDDEFTTYEIDSKYRLIKQNQRRLPSLGRALGISANLHYIIISDSSHTYVYDAEAHAIVFCCPIPGEGAFDFGLCRNQVVFKTKGNQIVLGDLKEGSYKTMTHLGESEKLKFATNDLNIIICDKDLLQMYRSCTYEYEQVPDFSLQEQNSLLSKFDPDSQYLYSLNGQWFTNCQKKRLIRSFPFKVYDETWEKIWLLENDLVLVAEIASNGIYSIKNFESNEILLQSPGVYDAAVSSSGRRYLKQTKNKLLLGIFQEPAPPDRKQSKAELLLGSSACQNEISLPIDSSSISEFSFFDGGSEEWVFIRDRTSLLLFDEKFTLLFEGTGNTLQSTGHPEYVYMDEKLVNIHNRSLNLAVHPVAAPLAQLQKCYFASNFCDYVGVRIRDESVYLIHGELMTKKQHEIYKITSDSMEKLLSRVYWKYSPESDKVLITCDRKVLIYDLQAQHLICICEFDNVQKPLYWKKWSCAVSGRDGIVRELSWFDPFQNPECELKIGKVNCRKQLKSTDSILLPSLVQNDIVNAKFKDELDRLKQLHVYKSPSILSHFITKNFKMKLEITLLKLLQSNDFENQARICDHFPDILDLYPSLCVDILNKMFRPVPNCSHSKMIGDSSIRVNCPKTRSFGHPFAIDKELWSTYGKTKLERGNNTCFSYVLSLPGFISVYGPYDAIVKSGNLELFESKAMKFAIQYKWDEYGRTVQTIRLLCYLILGFCYVYDQLESIERAYEFKGQKEWKSATSLVYGSLILSLCFLIEEVYPLVIEYWSAGDRLSSHRVHRHSITARTLDLFVFYNWKQNRFMRMVYSSSYWVEQAMRSSLTYFEAKLPTLVVVFIYCVLGLMYCFLIPIYFVLSFLGVVHRPIYFVWAMSKWDIMDIITYSALFFTCSCRINADRENPLLSSHNVRILSGWTSVLYAINLLNFLRPYHITGPLIRMFTQILNDMRSFMLLQFIILLGFVFAFIIILVDMQDGSYYGWLSFLSGYEMMLGDFERENFEAATQSATYHAYVLFFLYMFIVVIVSMNLLIAIMGDSYDRIRDNQDVEGRIEKARVLSSTDRIYGKLLYRLNETNFYPKYLHVLIPEHEIEDTTNTVWEGRLKAMERTLKAKLRENSNQMKAQFDELHKKENIKLQELHQELAPKKDSSDMRLIKKTLRAHLRETHQHLQHELEQVQNEQNQKLRALEKHLNRRLDSVEKKVNQKLDQVILVLEKFQVQS